MTTNNERPDARHIGTLGQTPTAISLPRLRLIPLVGNPQATVALVDDDGCELGRFADYLLADTARQWLLAEVRRGEY